MRKILLLLSAIAIVLSVSSCMGQYEYSKASSMSFVPDKVELKLTMNDYQYLGKTQISVEYKKYFGLFTYIAAVNEQPYNRRVQKQVSLKGDKDVSLRGKIELALYKVLETYPEADYYVPVNSVETVTQYFGGKKTKQVITVKCYKLKGAETPSSQN